MTTAWRPELDWGRNLGPVLRDHLPLLAALAAAILLPAIWASLRLRARRRGAAPPPTGLAGQLAVLALGALGVVAIVLFLPVSDTLKGQLLGLLGLAFTGVVAFSSTTFVANAMAGLMLRAVGNFRPGDWVRVGEQFGRVTERRLFHTEIQTEDRDLVTLPNLYLATNPFKVVRGSGTIVATELSLGYDRHHAEIEALLLEAAEASGLEEAFVQILELGDFSVTYRVAGFLSEVKQLLSVRSRLRTSVLDTLHGAGVEIVSPTFMNQRPLAEDVRFVPPRRPPTPRGPEGPPPEEIIFDKAERKASLEGLRGERETLLAEIAELEKQAGAAGKEDGARIRDEIGRRRARVEAIAARLEREETRQSEVEQKEG